MPPKRKSKANLAEVSTPKASSTPLRDDDSMDVDTPQASDTPRAADTPTASRPSQPPASEILNDLWTDDQTASLFKAIIRWKPSGIHKHFRMIAISEHLRNHGFDPDVETHTRIPWIWTQLGKFYNMDAINERDNSFDYVKGQDQDESPEKKYDSFDLPPDDFHDLMWARAMAEPGEEATSPAGDQETDAHASSVTGAGTSRKRKRGTTTTAADASSVAGSSTAKTRRSSTVEDTDQETPVTSSPVTRTARGARSQKRAAAKAKVESVEPEADEEGEDGDGEAEDGDGEGDGDGDDDDDEGDEEEGDHEETDAPATRSTRGNTARKRGRGRGRSKAGRKKG
ncbi:chromatin modification-related protein EAF7-domain-containing protein [Whalleya microplaca]|nr:chromatin modification-related protein EAF7-domain-containing protein [Whalleya microplaca]